MGSDCFFTATGDCRDMMKSQPPPKTQARSGSVHPTGASAKVLDYYTPAIAHIVNTLYARDLEILQYPVWDGTGPLPT